jgi:hypothetical protein
LEIEIFLSASALSSKPPGWAGDAGNEDSGHEISFFSLFSKDRGEFRSLFCPFLSSSFANKTKFQNSSLKIKATN